MAKILVVDDETAIRNLIVAVLEEEGYDAIGVASGAAALRVAPTERPDLVLLDMMMPGMDGRETLCRLREYPETRSTPVIVMSAAVTAEQCGPEAAAFLPKPFDLVVLLDTIEQALA
ncbi:MAG: response regulator [Thermomicrobiales bacterium]|nr:response regulator [Thermomicrobiales bacterium]